VSPEFFPLFLRIKSQIHARRSGSQPSSFGSLVDLEIHQETRNTGAFATFEEEARLGRSVCKLQTFEDWARTQKENSEAAATQPGWNKVSIVKLLTGRS